MGFALRAAAAVVVLPLLNAAHGGTSDPLNTPQSTVSGIRLEPLPVELVADLEMASSARLSPDGKWLASIVMSVPRDYVYPQAASLYVGTRMTIQVTELETGTVYRAGPSDGTRGSLAWSPDGSRLAFWAGDGPEARIWVWSREARSARSVGNFIPRMLSNPIAWTPDGRQVVAAVWPEGATALDFQTRTGKQSIDQDYPLDPIVAEARVAVYRSSPGEGDRSEKPAPSRGRLPDWLRAYRSDLAIVDVETGAAQRLATGLLPDKFRVSPDGRWIAFTHALGTEVSGVNYGRERFDVMVVPTGGGVARTLEAAVSQPGSMDISWSPSGDCLAYFSSNRDVSRFVMVTMATGERREVSVSGGRQYGSGSIAPFWSADGRRVLALSSEKLCVTEIEDGSLREFPAPKGMTLLKLLARGQSSVAVGVAANEVLVCARDRDSRDDAFAAQNIVSGMVRILRTKPANLAVPGDNRMGGSDDGSAIVFAEQSADRCAQLWVSDVEFQQPRCITRFNPQLAKYGLGKSRLLRWIGADGAKHCAAVLLPPDYQPGQKCPLLIRVYGDSALSNGVHYFGFEGGSNPLGPYDNMQLFATRGYAVMLVDTVTRVGTTMMDISRGVNEAVDQAIEAGYADPQRLAICGHSFGGYSTLAVMVQSPRFKAGIVFAGQPSLMDGFGQLPPDGNSWAVAWAENGQGKMGGSLWDKREQYIANSPLFFFDHIKGAVLVIHGTYDSAVAVHLGDETFQALRRAGKEVEYAKYLGEIHSIVGTANSIDCAHRMIRWLDQHLSAKPDPRESVH